MKIYTRKGDAGFTNLLGSQRVRKDDSRIEAGGLMDELNCWIGHAASEARRVGHDTTVNTLTPVQADLFALSTHVAALGTGKAPRGMSYDVIADVEARIDAISDQLPSLAHFILPGGCELATRLHLCRAACRRAERGVVHLLNPLDDEFVHDPLTVQYLNRLSDLLFVLTRLVNQDAGCADQPWPPAEV
jgi:cob(I)alamin adenosyltransferase